MRQRTSLLISSLTILTNLKFAASSLRGEASFELRAFNTTRQISELPPPNDWPNHPLFIKSNPDACGGTLEVKGLQKNDPCPIGKPFEFESELFKGKLLFRVRDLKNSDDRKNNDLYFIDKKQYNQFIIQGQFKKEVKAKNVLYGGEFKKPLKRAPPAWLEKAISAVFDRINPGIQFRLSANKPSALVNLPGSVQVIRADLPGDEPDISSFEVEENNSAFGTGLSNQSQKESFPADSKSRKKFFSNIQKSKDVVFDTKTVYTFEHYDQIMDYKNYIMDIGVSKIDMARILDSEPFQIMAKDTEEGKHLWSFQLWHEKLL